MRDSFIFYRSFYESVKEIPEENQLKVYEALFEYALNQNEIDLLGIEKAIFSLIKPQLDANQKKYENGCKGGRQKTKLKPNDNQIKTKLKPNNNLNKTKAKPNDNPMKMNNENENENVNVNDNENDNEKENIKRKSKSNPEESKIHFAEFVSMTNAEYEKLVSTYGKDFADQCITVLDNYKRS